MFQVIIVSPSTRVKGVAPPRAQETQPLPMADTNAYHALAAKCRSAAILSAGRRAIADKRLRQRPGAWESHRDPVRLRAPSGIWSTPPPAKPPPPPAPAARAPWTPSATSPHCRARAGGDGHISRRRGDPAARPGPFCAVADSITFYGGPPLWAPVQLRLARSDEDTVDQPVGFEVNDRDLVVDLAGNE